MTDISDIVRDPDFATVFQLETRVESVDTRGRASFEMSVADVTGAVIPDSEAMQRQPDGSRLSGSIKVYTSHPLSSPVAGKEGDVIIWNGLRYTVMEVSDFSRWDGLRVASCELIPFNR